MKRSIKIVAVLIFLVISLFTAYKIGQHNAHLQIRKANPENISKAMLSDDFYGQYADSILQVTGNVYSLHFKNGKTYLQFEIAKSGSVLPDVTCEINNITQLKKGSTVTVFTVAHDAKRQNAADVLLDSCYLLK